MGFRVEFHLLTDLPLGVSNTLVLTIFIKNIFCRAKNEITELFFSMGSSTSSTSESIV